jgi:hypothetical protein
MQLKIAFEPWLHLVYFGRCRQNSKPVPWTCISIAVPIIRTSHHDRTSAKMNGSVKYYRESQPVKQGWFKVANSLLDGLLT